MSKGNLVYGPGTKLWNFLELLDSLEVTPENLEAFRKASSWQHMITAAVLQGDQYCLNLLSLEIEVKKAGFSAEEIGNLAGVGKEDLLRGFRQVLLGNAEIKLLDFWRVLEDLAIQIPALKRPTLEDLQKQFPWIKKIDGKDTSPTEAVALRLGTVLRPDESCVNGQEYERRLAALRPNMAFGLQQAQWLVEHQDEFPAFMALPGGVYVDFPGLVVVGAFGSRHFPHLRRDGKRWCLLWRWASYDLFRGGRVASK